MNESFEDVNSPEAKLRALQHYSRNALDSICLLLASGKIDKAMNGNFVALNTIADFHDLDAAAFNRNPETHACRFSKWCIKCPKERS